jgi:DNA-binding transcriptional MerR regulator
MPTLGDLTEATRLAADSYRLEEQAAKDFLQLQINNQERLASLRREHNQQIYDEMLKMGVSVEDLVNKKSLDQRLKAIEEEKQARINAAKAAAGGSLSDEALAAIKEEFEIRARLEEENDKALRKQREKAEKKVQAQRLKDASKVAAELYKTPASIIFGPNKEAQAEMTHELKEKGYSDDEIKQALKQARFDAASASLNNIAEKLAQQGEQIAKSQTEIDTRLQGLRESSQRKFMGSYWQAINQDIGAAIGVSPFIKQEDVVSNLKTLVGKGIAANVEQRAFLMTLSDKIATTFDAADSTLVKLVRIQQADTTAARLGMESALTSFLNSMYETTEYMTDAAASIRANLYEASALMDASAATAFEYQVQKWMGSLYSVGFSNAEGLASAFGKLAAGDISGITDGGYGNLLVMAANKANVPVTEILANGLDESKTNELFAAMVNYLAQIYEETKDSKVVAQQFANVYGLSASDLKAAANLHRSIISVTSQNMTSSTMVQQLTNMANTMYQRTSMGEMMHNAMDNLSYTMAEGLGNNPVLFATYQIANMLDQFGGGINIPFINAMGFGVDLNATVADLMKVGAVSGSVLQGLGKLVASLGSGGGFSGSGMLKKFGVTSGVTAISRGNGAGLLTVPSGTTISSSGYIGNESSSDVQDKTLSDATEGTEAQLAQAKDENDDVKIKQVDEHVVQIYNLLSEVTTGTSKFHVMLDNPGAWTINIGAAGTTI